MHVVTAITSNSKLLLAQNTDIENDKAKSCELFNILSCIASKYINTARVKIILLLFMLTIILILILLLFPNIALKMLSSLV